MSIEISPETERLVRDELVQGHFRSVDELILFGVWAWRQRHAPEANGPRNGRDRADRFVAWAKGHPPSTPLSDDAVSRASLNPDRW